MLFEMNFQCNRRTPCLYFNVPSGRFLFHYCWHFSGWLFIFFFLYLFFSKIRWRLLTLATWVRCCFILKCCSVWVSPHQHHNFRELLHCFQCWLSILYLAVLISSFWSPRDRHLHCFQLPISMCILFWCKTQ